MSDSSDYFEVIDSQYQIIQSSIRQQPNKHYEVNIKPSKNEVDLNLLQSQFYDFEIIKSGQKLTSIQRRYSQFSLIYEILSKKQPGYIFPAFPQNGIFVFMKSKVTMIKDESFVKRRIKVIQRFFNKLFNDQQYHPEVCKEIKEFISEGKEFEARKQIEKGNSSSLYGFSWNKLKTYFTVSKQNKYKQHQDKILELKTSYESLYIKCHQLIQLLKQQQLQNTKIELLQDQNNYLVLFKQLMKNHDHSLKDNITSLQTVEFSLFCQNEDLMMAKKIIDRMNELKNDEDNYAELKQTEQKFGSKIDKFLEQKAKNRARHNNELQRIVRQIKSVSRFT